MSHGVPDIPPHVGEDVPPGEASVALKPTNKVKSPEDKHRRKLDRENRAFGRKLIYLAGGLIVLIAIGAFAAPDRVDGTIIPSIVDFAKLVTTTAIGYIFAAKTHKAD